MMDGACVMQVV